MSIKNSSKYLFYLSDIAMDWSDHAMWWPEKNIWLDNTRWTLDQYNITGYLLSEYNTRKVLIKILPGSAVPECICYSYWDKWGAKQGDFHWAMGCV